LEDVRVAGLNALPFEDASFDLVTTLDVIEHIDDDVAALREMRRVARPEGRLLVTVPAYPALWSSHDELNHHRRRYTRETLLAAVERAGWQPLRTTFFNSLLLPVAAAYRLAERWGLTPPGQTSAGHEAQLELATSWVNGLLERILLTEAEVIAGGRRRLPAGLSLMAIMRPARPIAGGPVGRPPAMDRAPSAERKAADRVQGS
jgi:SAM-dependent methyltransferase